MASSPRRFPSFARGSLSAVARAAFALALGHAPLALAAGGSGCIAPQAPAAASDPTPALRRRWQTLDGQDTDDAARGRATFVWGALNGDVAAERVLRQVTGTVLGPLEPRVLQRALADAERAAKAFPKDPGAWTVVAAFRRRNIDPTGAHVAACLASTLDPTLVGDSPCVPPSPEPATTSLRDPLLAVPEACAVCRDGLVACRSISDMAASVECLSRFDAQACFRRCATTTETALP